MMHHQANCEASFGVSHYCQCCRSLSLRDSLRDPLSVYRSLPNMMLSLQLPLLFVLMIASADGFMMLKPMHTVSIISTLLQQNNNSRSRSRSRSRSHHSSAAPSSGVSLGMGKGLNKAKNKQAELARRMELAKQQREEDVLGPSDDQKKSFSDEEMKAKNDRLRFDAMLKTNSVASSEYEEGGYLSVAQEEEEIKAARSGLDRLFEGDPAPSQPFEELVSIQPENAVGGASRILPWLRTNNRRSNDYLIIITEPRLRSPELRATMKTLAVELPADILNRLIVVNADSPAENRRWTKKNSCFDIDIYSDEKREWMKAYTALGADRLSMSLFVVADERIQRLAREVDGLQATMIVTNAVKSLNL